jgi:hypothetical protein
MTIECIGPSFTYRWPGGEVHLEPGKPVDLPDARAQRLLNKAPDKVRVCPPTIQPGALVTWVRGDGTRPIGFVDVLHMDPDGKEWAFVSYGKTWAAVDRRLLTVVTA